MNLGENIRLAWEGLRAGKMRAFLTMLGIIIGIGSVIGILTVGSGLTDSINSEMSTLGANNIIVMLQSKSNQQSGFMRGYEDKDLMTDDMIEALRARYPDAIQYVSLTSTLASGTAKDGKKTANLSLDGVNTDYFDANDVKMLAGSTITESDIDNHKMKAVVSDRLVNNLFDGDVQAALGKKISVYTNFEIYTFTVVGVYKYEQNMMNMSFAAAEDVSTSAYIPITVAQKLSGAAEGYASITIMTTSAVSSANFAAVAEHFLNKYYKNNENYQVAAMSMESILSTVDSMMGTVNIAIAAIAAISLLVGGIGVMNIMLVSVTERTREIGTRKAIGATNGNIRMQFVVESVIICSIGGVIGILFGGVLGYVGSTLIGAPAVPKLSYILLAVGFSMAIGIFFGYYPANKAAKMDPVEALRYE
ncbi:MAG: ABC transporter permease [Oscillospiraceae bacterium]|jgi:putative ABC transport system permease protein|nr:MAG: ABC transporter permease [Oscillospiraceae bacterium]